MSSNSIICIKKECRSCNAIKDLSEFDKNKKGKDGRHCYCKSCRAEKRAEYLKNNRDKVRKSQAIWREQNREKIREGCKRFYYSHIEEQRERSRIKNKTVPKEKRRKWGRESSKRPNGIFNSYKTNAKKRGLEFDVSRELFVSLIGKPCVYCGEEARGVDRINNSLGYIPTNIQPCCSICNHMKHTLGVREFINHCRKIAKQYRIPART